MTSVAPMIKDMVKGSFKIKNERIIALMGTKFIKIPARMGPICLIPS